MRLEHEQQRILNRLAAEEMARRSMVLPVRNPIRDGRIVTLSGETEDDAWKRYHAEVRALRVSFEAGKYGCGVHGPGTRACNHHPDGVPLVHPDLREPAQRYPSEAWPLEHVAEVRYPGLTGRERRNTRVRRLRRRRWPSIPGPLLRRYNRVMAVETILMGALLCLAGDPRPGASLITALLFPLTGATLATLFLCWTLSKVIPDAG